MVRLGDQEVIWRCLSPLLVDAGIEKIGFDLKWVFALCFKRGVTPRGDFFDILIAAYLLDPTRTNYKISDIVRKYASLEMPDIRPRFKTVRRTATSPQVLNTA